MLIIIKKLSTFHAHYSRAINNIQLQLQFHQMYKLEEKNIASVKKRNKIHIKTTLIIHFVYESSTVYNFTGIIGAK